MKQLQKRIWLAILVGMLLSVSFFLLGYATPNRFLYGVQVVGLYVCWLVEGIHSATTADYALIAVPVNAILYALVVLVFRSLFASRKPPNSDSTR